ncbi:MAG: SUMF1/EgtB/PvdO family nonheme iron enzyme, partial [Kiritimatiellae bacterium]|nr:SUMF1/EgtB/PvdO family nonheme iron enzyme [Kiritimatiellia bacterium]
MKVEYRITGVESPVDITVTAYDGDRPLDSAKLASSMKGDLFGIANDNYYSFSIDPVKAFGKSNIAVMNFNVRLSTTASAANMTDVLYKIVDLNSGAVTDVRRADFYGGKYGAFETSYSAIKEGFSTDLQDVLIWTGVTNNPIYKTDFLVLRHIPASSWGPWKIGAYGGGNSAGSSQGNMSPSGVEHLVQLTEDYYIGVFPITQAQHMKIYGTYGRAFTNASEYADHQYKPASGVKWFNVRSYTGRGVDSKTQPPESGSFCGLLSTKTGFSFDLPTEAQWEFAARGGVTNSSLYSNAIWDGVSIDELGWSEGNVLASDQVTAGNAGYESAQTVPVGRRYPNAFGLYDMCGNVMEYCLDYSDGFTYKVPENPPALDPKGVDMTNAKVSNAGYKYHVMRG